MLEKSPDPTITFKLWIIEEHLKTTMFRKFPCVSNDELGIDVDHDLESDCKLKSIFYMETLFLDHENEKCAKFHVQTCPWEL